MSYIPPVTKNLLIINVLFFLGRYVAARYGIDLDDVLGLHFVLASRFHLYQMFTYMFMHASWSHIFFNMFAVWMFGCTIENHMGSRKYLLFYLTCGLGAALTQEVTQFVQYVSTGLNAYDQVALAGSTVNMGEYLNLWTTVGASGAVYGILLAFGMTFPDHRIFIFPLPVPIKAKYFVAGYAVIELLMGLGASHDGVAHFAHLGGIAEVSLGGDDHAVVRLFDLYVFRCQPVRDHLFSADLHRGVVELRVVLKDSGETLGGLLQPWHVDVKAGVVVGDLRGRLHRLQVGEF